MKSRLEVNQVTHTGSIRKLGYAFYFLSVLICVFVCIMCLVCIIMCVRQVA